MLLKLEVQKIKMLILVFWRKQMVIQGERIYPLDIQKVVDNIFGNSQHAKRKESLANAALGVIKSASLIVHRIGLGLAAAKKLLGKHAVKQVDRLLSNTKLIVWCCFEKTVPYILGSRTDIVVAMDWTDFDADKQATLSINLVTTHGRATPLIWKTFNKKGLKNKRNDYEDELLVRFKEVLPEGVKVTVLADRGFGDTKLYDFLKQDLGFDFVIRFRGNILVTDDKGETRKAQDWVGVGGRAKTLRNAKVTALSCIVPTVVCVKAAGMKQAWCIAASNPSALASTLIKWYAKRWGIEPQFRDTKDLHFGMGLSETSIGDPERRDRLLLISSIAVFILTLLGAVGEKLGMDRYLKANTVKHRTMSLFRQGCHYYNQLLGMTKQELKNFLNCFVELLEEQKNIQDILWVI
jgi:Transposase DDE domain